MRRLAPALALFVAACATAPQKPEPQVPTASTPAPRETRLLLGLTASDLVARFGTPHLQVREGSSLKIQFRGMRCVLDAYLYPEQGHLGHLRVTHVDTRTPTGADTDQAACISALDVRS